MREMFFFEAGRNWRGEFFKKINTERIGGAWEDRLPGPAFLCFPERTDQVGQIKVQPQKLVLSQRPNGEPLPT